MKIITLNNWIHSEKERLGASASKELSKELFLQGRMNDIIREADKLQSFASFVDNIERSTEGTILLASKK